MCDEDLVGFNYLVFVVILVFLLWVRKVFGFVLTLRLVLSIVLGRGLYCWE